MARDGSDGGEAGRAWLRMEEQVRLELEAASYGIWIGLAHLLATRWDDEAAARRIASEDARKLADLAKLRCLPDGRPLAADAVYRGLLLGVTTDGKTPEGVVERFVVRRLAGKPRSDRTPAEIASLIDAFLRCYAADCERGEAAWVDELYATAAAGGAPASWTLDLPRADGPGEDATVLLRIPAAALEAALLRPGDRLILEPRPGGLWLGRAPRLRED